MRGHIDYLIIKFIPSTIVNEEGCSLYLADLFVNFAIDFHNLSPAPYIFSVPNINLATRCNSVIVQKSPFGPFFIFY